MKQGILSVLKTVGIYLVIILLNIVKGILSAIEFIAGNLVKASNKGLENLNKKVLVTEKKA